LPLYWTGAMTDSASTLADKIRTATGVVAALIALLAGLGQLADKLPQALKKFHGTSPETWWGLLAFLLGLGIWLLIAGVSKRSRLLKPEALSLNPNDQKHLRGRDFDIDALCGLCEQNPLIFLEGESGVGKTALIRAGLMPTFTERGSICPLYLSGWSGDWDKGPANTLADSLWRSLSTEDRKVLDLVEPITPDTTGEVLHQFKQKLGRTPLLIFDQFDDYQTLYHSKFLQIHSTWLSARQLAAINPFWKEVQEFLSGSVIHCLFATRSDSAGGLESVRFVESRTYRLDRLQSIYVLPLLEELTRPSSDANPVISNPDKGWNRLKQRLARDLTVEGVVLPVQMKITFQGLANLGALTIHEYEGGGGLRGIEAAHIEENIGRAARQSGLSKQQVRRLIVGLVDVERAKTIPRTLPSFRQMLANDMAVVPPDLTKRLEVALEVLQQREIVRKRTDPLTSEGVWLLDHDFLCRGVAAADRRANRWNSLVEERSRQYADAGPSAWQKWRALLRPQHQVVLLYQRWFGSFRYGKSRSFATLSLLTFLPYLLAMCLAVLGIRSERAFRAREDAAAILASIGQSQFSPTPSEIASLYKLSASPTSVRRSFLAQTVSNADTAERVYRRLDMVMNAAIGLDPGGAQRKYLMEKVLRPTLKTRRSPQVIILSIGFWCRLAESDHGFARLALERFPEIAYWDLRETNRVSGPPANLQYLAHKLDTPAIDKAAVSLVRVMQRDPINGLSGLPWLLGAFAGKLDKEGARKVAALLIPVMERPSRRWDLRYAAETMAALQGKVRPFDMDRTAQLLVAAMGRTESSLDLGLLAEDLGSIRGNIDASLFQQAAARLMAAMGNTSDPFALDQLADGLRAIGTRLDAASSRRAAMVLTGAIRKMTFPQAVYAPPLFQALGAVVGKLGDSYRRRAVHLLLARTQQVWGYYGGAGPDDWGLEEFVGALDGTNQGRFAGLLLHAMEEPSSGQAIGLLARVLGDMAKEGKLDAARSHKAAALLAADIQWTSDHYVMSLEGERSGAVAGKRNAPAREAAAVALAAIQRGVDVQELPSMAEGLRALAGKTVATYSHRSIPLLIRAIEKTSSPYYLRPLTTALDALADKPNAADLQNLADLLIARMNKPYEYGVSISLDMDFLAEALEPLTKWMREKQLVELLRSPLCVGALRSSVLGALERRTGHHFHNNPWEFVGWAHAARLDREFGLQAAQ
jgi:Novel STAND NTPase 1